MKYQPISKNKVSNIAVFGAIKSDTSAKQIAHHIGYLDVKAIHQFYATYGLPWEMQIEELTRNDGDILIKLYGI